MTDQPAGTLLVIVGLPGSGKSELIKELAEQHGQVETYDDYQAGAYGDFSDPRLSRHFGLVLRDLLQGKTAIVADIGFCSREALDLFLAVVLAVVPNARWTVTHFENNPKQCQRNCWGRQRNVVEEYANIAKYTAVYEPPSPARPVYSPDAVS